MEPSPDQSMTAIGHQSEIPAAGSAATSGASPPAQPRAPLRVNLFFKYVALVFAVVLIALLTNGAFEVWFSYQEYKESLIRIQRGQAEAAAAKIGQFIHEIEAQVGWTTQLPWSASTPGAAALRCLAALASSACNHRTLATRRDRPRTIACLAPRHGCDRQRDRLFERSEVHRGHGPQGLLWPGLFPPRVGALHDLGARRHHPQRRCVSRRGQPQADLGRGLADQGRRARPCLRGRRARPADRASRHQSRLAQHRSVASRAGAGCARTSCREADGAGAGSRRYPNTPCAHRLRADRAAWLDHVRRATGRRGLRTALFDARAFRLDPARGFAARAGRRAHAGAPDGGADPGAAARRGAHRLR